MPCEQARQAITNAYTLPEVDECISKLVCRELRNDFKQELFLILLQVPCEKVEQMNGTFKYFIVRIILNLARQKRNVFHKTYLDKTVQYDTDILNYQISSPADQDVIAERMDREKVEEAVINELKVIDERLGNDNYPYHQAIIKLVSESASIREASRKTGIDRATITKTLKRVREYFK